MSLNDYEIACANLVKSIKAKIEEAKAEGTFKISTDETFPNSVLNYFLSIGYEVRIYITGTVLISWSNLNKIKRNTKQLLSCQ